LPPVASSFDNDPFAFIKVNIGSFLKDLNLNDIFIRLTSRLKRFRLFLSLQAIEFLSCQIRDSGKIFSPVVWQPKINFFSNQLILNKIILIPPAFYFGINLALIINALE
jgi:hypothetical protein